MNRPKRFTTLEGMRGIAAICVVLMHADTLFGSLHPASAYLAVDFFFVLSGFIMAHVYAAPLAGGMSGWAFMRARIIRLYPLYLAGTLSGVLFAIIALLRHSDALWAFTQPPVTLPFAVLMLPSPASNTLFPLDVPAWSLLLELAANAAFAVTWLRRGRVLLAITGLAAIAVAAATLECGHADFGWDTASSLWGLARVGFSFPLGVLLHRVYRHVRLPAALDLLPVLALPALMFVAPTGPARIAFDLAFIFVVSPALLLAAASSKSEGPRRTRVYLFLGLISYPLYILHHPALQAGSGAIERHVASGPAGIAAGCVVVAALIGLAYGAARLDSRLRATIVERLRQAARQVEAAST